MFIVGWRIVLLEVLHWGHGSVADVQAGKWHTPLSDAPDILQLTPHHHQLLWQLSRPQSQWCHLLLSLHNHLKQVRVVTFIKVSKILSLSIYLKASASPYLSLSVVDPIFWLVSLSPDSVSSLLETVWPGSSLSMHHSPPELCSAQSPTTMSDSSQHKQLKQIQEINESMQTNYILHPYYIQNL